MVQKHLCNDVPMAKPACESTAIVVSSLLLSDPASVLFNHVSLSLYLFSIPSILLFVFCQHAVILDQSDPLVCINFQNYLVILV